MIEVEKTYSDNPFVDELIYHSKYLALNAVIKDEEEALASETAESLRNGQIYLACVEGMAKFEMFASFPEEILEKYIAIRSNLDLMVENHGAYLAYLNSLNVHERTTLIANIDKLARAIYIDHYDTMMYYIQNLDGDWLSDNADLYNRCKTGTATYVDLFEEIPEYTRRRVVKQYVRNFDGTDLNTVCASLANFQAYLDEREDEEQELDYIEQALRSIFISHYEIMQERDYIGTANENNWWDYLQYEDNYNACIEGTATYHTLFLLFPEDDLREVILSSLTDVPSIYIDDIVASVDNLTTYLQSYSNVDLMRADIGRLNSNMRKMYIDNYRLNLNFDYYNKAQDGLIGFDVLYKCMPDETVKIILNNYIQEVTNINVYANNNDMLLSYLSTLPESDANRIMDSLASEMRTYYIENYVEKNNYYRTIIGLPPLGDDKKRYTDTLLGTYDERSGMYMNFGNVLIEMIPEGIYPDAHWTESELYEFDPYDISILNNYGVFDKFYELAGRNSRDKRYRYMNYLGDNALSIYTARKALNFELMSLPTVTNTEVRNRFIDKYAINRDYIIRTVYTDSHKFQSDYYNKFIIIFILINTIMDVLSDVPSLIIDREIFDSRSIKYLFESFGIPYYAEIPVKYQQAMLKNLNILIKYKSSTRNMVDICSLFGFDDIKVFEYWMLKDRQVDPNSGAFLFKDKSEISYEVDNLYVVYPDGPFVDNTTGLRFSRLDQYYDYDAKRYTHKIHVKDDNGDIIERVVVNSNIDCYIKVGENRYVPLSESDYYSKVYEDIQPCDVKFIKVPIKEQLTEYKNDGDYINSYDDITLGDDTWDGGLLHDYIKNEILDYEFNAVRTKYISVETVTQLTEIAFQVSYFYNMLFDNLYSEENLTVEIPYIKVNHKFKFIDVVCYLFSMMYLYHGLDDKIMYDPSQMIYIKGYYFNDDVNKLLQDPNRFTQTSDPSQQENIFSINEMIAKDAFNYQEAFENYKIKAFNLDADVDALDDWLHNYQYSMGKNDKNFISKAQWYTDRYNTLGLKNFVVCDIDDDKNPYKNIRDLTLWDFYSLNNSHYQKDIFTNALMPTEYNQDIDYGFDITLLEKVRYYDLNSVEHEYAVENGELGVIVDDTEARVFVINNYKYAMRNNGRVSTTLYNMFDRVHNYLIPHTLYYMTDGEFYPLYCIFDPDEESGYTTDGLIYIKDHGNYVYATTDYYTRSDNGDGTFTYQKITDPNLFSVETIINEYGEEENRYLLNFGDYFESEKDIDGNYKLKPDNDYIVIYQNNVPFYALYADKEDYANEVVPEEDLFVQDGTKFIHLTDSDFFDPTWDPEDDYAYIEDNCFVQVDHQTEYFDPEIPDVYYMRLTDYYEQTEYRIDESMHYVKDSNGNYIPITNIVDPNNCYDKIADGYYLVANDLTIFVDYASPKPATKMYILNEDNSYTKYEYSITADNCNPVETDNSYVNESSKQYILILSNKNYERYNTTKEMVVVFNKYTDTKTPEEDDEDTKYDPEKTDGVWDENDWFYEDPGFDPGSGIGMNGENKWYYKKPGSIVTPLDNQEINFTPVGSGFYLDASTYLGSVSLEEGEKYFLSMDVECNFEGKIRIACEADSENTDISTRIYNSKIGEAFHVSQTFIANGNTRPKIIFYIYNYDEYPINRGDYLIVRNFNLIKSHNDSYIAQDIPSYDKLQQIYRVNEMCYRYLCRCMNECTDYETFNVYKKIYDTLMTSEYNKEMFKLKDGSYAETYTDFLQQRDSVLYEKLVFFKSLDEESMRKEIADNIIEVTYAIDDCVDTYSYGYLYSYFPAVSASYIQQYIVKIIDFFKSWKVHLLGINTVYRFDDALENTVKILYDMKMKNIIKTKDTVYVNDSVKINPLDDVDPDGTPYRNKDYKIIIGTELDENGNEVPIYENTPIELITHGKEDAYRIDHGLKVIDRTADGLRYRENEVDLLLNDENISAYTDDTGHLIITGSDGFSIEINNLIYDNAGDIINGVQFNVWSPEVLREILVLNGGRIDTEEFITALNEFIEENKEIIAEQAMFDSTSINEINLKTSNHISNIKED